MNAVKAWDACSALSLDLLVWGLASLSLHFPSVPQCKDGEDEGRAYISEFAMRGHTVDWLR